MSLLGPREGVQRYPVPQLPEAGKMLIYPFARNGFTMAESF